MYILYFILLSMLPTNGLILLKSTAFLDLSWPISNEQLDLNTVYQIEKATAEFFQTKNNFLDVQVQATDSLVKSSRQFVSASITTIYENDLAFDLDTLLAKNMEGFNDIFVPFLGTDTAESLIASFLPNKPTEIIPTQQEEGRIAADKGLIFAVACLSTLLILLSSIVMYVSGGWSVCKNMCIQCLFEEVVEEEEFPLDKQNTFQVNSYDEESHSSNIVQQTPSRVDYDEEETQMSANTKALGITSMRKLAKEDNENETGLISMLRFSSSK